MTAEAPADGLEELPEHAGPEATAFALEVADLKVVLAEAEKVERGYVVRMTLAMFPLMVFVLTGVASGRAEILLAALLILALQAWGTVLWLRAEREVSRLRKLLDEAEGDLAGLLTPPGAAEAERGS